MDSVAVNVRIERSLIDEIDNYRQNAADYPSRPEAIRRILQERFKAVEG